MTRTSHTRHGRAVLVTLVSALALGPVLLRADEGPAAVQPGGDAWTRTVNLVRHGNFADAYRISRTLPHGALTGKVQNWLEAYADETAQRRDMNRADYDMYVRYARQRADRKEYAPALQRAIQALDNIENHDELLKEPWLEALVKDALVEGSRLRKDGKWDKAWEIYYYLGLLYEREPRYEKLERECVTHIRLDRMFEDGVKWDEPIRDITWRMAEQALGYVDRLYYEDVVPFKAMTESGLEQLLLLADSKSARKVFDGLGNEDDRAAFINRLQYKLDETTAQRAVDRRYAVGVFSRALEINRQTVNLPENLVVSELMRGAFEPLDDFTSVIWPAEFDEFNKHTRGDFVGVGISIRKNPAEEIQVVTPLAFTPAYRAGVQAGDIIVKVNGTPLAGMSLNKTVETITGPRGTDVTLTIRRDDEELNVTLRREQVVIETVTGIERLPDDPENWNYWVDRDNGIGYVRVSSFARNTVDILNDVLSDLRREGLKGLVLDLRGDPGGLLDAAEQMASLFLSRNMKVHSIKGRNPRDNKEYFTRDDGPFTDVPLTVLVDENSASASEIVSGALRDNRRATVIGARTFGKFSVQNLVPISRVPPAALKITTARYYLPSGVSLHRTPGAVTWGVDPNIPVRLVRKEKLKYLQVQRKRDVLGPTADEAADKTKAEGAQPEPNAGQDGDDAGTVGQPGDEDGTVGQPGDEDGTVAPAGDDTGQKSGSDGKQAHDAGERAAPSTAGDHKDRTHATGNADTAGNDADTVGNIANGAGHVANGADDGTDTADDNADTTGAGVNTTGAGVHTTGDDTEGTDATGDDAENKLPPLEQPDDNNRPDADPQLDTALLLMRVTLLGQAYPTLAAASTPPEPAPDPIRN